MFRKLVYLFIFILVAAYLTNSFKGSDDKPKVSKTDTTKKTETSSVSKINQKGRDALVKQYTDPGYVESSFPSSSSFWILIKDPPNPADAYAKIVCKQAKNDYNTKGFVITIWKLGTTEKYGKAPCY